MDGVEWLESFYETIGEDPRIGTTHISVYLALVYEWSRAEQAEYLVLNRNTIIADIACNSIRLDKKGFAALQEEPEDLL